MNYFKELIFNFRLKRAIKKADFLSKTRKKKHIVFKLNEKPFVCSKQRIKLAIRQHKLKQHTTIQEIEKNALYITD